MLEEEENRVRMARIGIRDVAKAAGVSITTVSKALNGYGDVSNKTREKIEAIAKELNYEPDLNARALGGRYNVTIALLLSGLEKSDEGGFTFGIISGVYHSTSESGVEFILLTTSYASQCEKSYIQLCRQKNVDGAVVIGIRTDDPYYQEVVQSQIPCVLIDVAIEGKNIVTVSTDNEKAACEAVSFLIGAGHKNIAMLNGSVVAEVSKYRFAGYASALEQAEILLNLDYVAYADFSEALAYEKTLGLMQENEEISAIFCASDIMALGAIRAVKELGKKIPDDISVIGFDDIPTAKYISGGLTTVRQDPFQLGKKAGEIVFKMIRKQKTPNHIWIPHEFMERRTTKSK